jgi:hypothetical protein
MAIKTYGKIVNGKVSGLQNVEEIYISGFNGNWIEIPEGFGFGDIYSETNGWSHPVKSQEEIEAKAKAWRDNELKSTDYIVPLTDHPDQSATLTYRQELRDWPSTDAFPETKPVKP